jgi:threonine dehydratase
MGTVAKAHRPPIEVIGVQPQLFPSMYGKIKGEALPCGGDTLAEGVAVKEPGAYTSRVVERVVDDIVLVSEAELEAAVALLLQIEKTVVEGAGAAGLAAVLAHRDRFCRQEGRPRADRRQHRHAPAGQRAAARPRPLGPPRAPADLAAGSAGRAAQGDAGCSRPTTSTSSRSFHQRIFTDLPAKGLVTDIECEARDRAQLDKLVAHCACAATRSARSELN